jgi:hypothetical protein
VNDGIDMLIGYNNKMFAINLFTATTRSFLGREKRENRHKVYENIHYLELPVDFRGSFTCGQFFLYKEVEYNKLINELDSVVNQGTYELGHQL